MAKIRGVKPETWTDEKFVSVSPLARLLFIGMWNHACDNGHIDNSPMQLKMRILPADNCDVEALRDELIAAGMVLDHGHLKIPTLPTHQRPDKRFITLCEHCAHDEHTTYRPEDLKPRPTSAPRAPKGRTASAPRVHHDDGDGDGELITLAHDADASRASSSIDDDFDDWYSQYPRKVGKGQAVKAYRKARKSTDHRTLVDSLNAQIPALTAKGKEFIPHPATWLNGERWNDELESETPDNDGWYNPPEPPADLLANYDPEVNHG